MKQLIITTFFLAVLLIVSCSSSKNATEAAVTTETTVSDDTNRTRPDGPRQRPSPEQRAAITEQLIKDVGMDAEQAEQFKAVNEKYRNKMRELRQSADGWEGMREKMMALREAQKEEMSAFLTEEQMEKLSQLQAERRTRRGPRGRGGRGQRGGGQQ